MVPWYTSSTINWHLSSHSYSVMRDKPSTTTSRVVLIQLRRPCSYTSPSVTSLVDPFTRWDQRYWQPDKFNNSAKHVWTPTAAQDPSLSTSLSSEEYELAEFSGEAGSSWSGTQGKTVIADAIINSFVTFRSACFPQNNSNWTALSGEANAWRNRQHVVIDPLPHFKIGQNQWLLS